MSHYKNIEIYEELEFWIMRIISSAQGTLIKDRYYSERICKAGNTEVVFIKQKASLMSKFHN